MAWWMDGSMVPTNPSGIKHRRQADRGIPHQRRYLILLVDHRQTYDMNRQTYNWHHPFIRHLVELLFISLNDAVWSTNLILLCHFKYVLTSIQTIAYYTEIWCHANKDSFLRTNQSKRKQMVMEPNQPKTPKPSQSNFVASCQFIEAALPYPTVGCVQYGTVAVADIPARWSWRPESGEIERDLTKTLDGRVYKRHTSLTHVFRCFLQTCIYDR